MNKKFLIIGGFVVAAAVGFYLYTRSNKSSEGELKKGLDDASEGKADSIDSMTSDIRTDLKWVANKKTAVWLATFLNKGKGKNLRNWVNLIRKERAADPSKWKESADYSGETSDIGSALYQMSQQGTHGVAWTNEMRFGLIDNH